MTRPGHHRPIGTTTTPQRFEWCETEPPALNDVAFECPDGQPNRTILRRGFLVVGVEETASRQLPYRLMFERLGFDDAIDRVAGGAPTWTFHKLPRSS